LGGEWPLTTTNVSLPILNCLQQGGTLRIDEISVVDGEPSPCLVDEVVRLENTLGTRFPRGYREYVTTFGDGVLGGSYIRIYSPAQVAEGDNNVHEWRKRVSEYWFWDAGKKTLSKDKAVAGIICGDTVDGDELIFHPSEPDRIYVLPRYSEDIHVAGDGLLDAIDWLCSSGQLTEPFTEREFIPFDLSQQS